MRILFWIILLCSVLYSNNVFAVSSQEIDKKIEKIMEEIQKAPDDKKEGLFFEKFKLVEQKDIRDKAAKEFAGFNWGIGLTFTQITGKTTIDEAKVINGKVRTTKEHQSAASLMFETHYLVKLNNPIGDTTAGIGPFVAIRLTEYNYKEGNIKSEIGAYGVGLMMGFMRKPDSKSSWNLGIGYYVDTKVKEFGSGVAEGQPLPGSETEIRYKETDASGFMFMISSTFY